MRDMRRFWLIATLAACAIACKSDPEPGEDTPAGNGSGSGSAGSAALAERMHAGFGASLGADLAKGSNGSAVMALVGSAGSDAGSGSGVAAVAGSDSGSGSATVVAAKTGSATSPTPAPVQGSGAGSAAAQMTPQPHVAQKLTPELAAIKFELLPNWKRDVVEGGSFTLGVDPPSGGATKQFTFYYGYDDPHAPADRDAYMKWLADSSLLEVKLNRQSGAAWYLQGTNANGEPAFRFVVNYGGKHLICYGTLYKDPESSRLGDIRDEVVNQAKKMCESIGL
jgi:hypothetical protein